MGYDEGYEGAGSTGASDLPDLEAVTDNTPGASLVTGENGATGVTSQQPSEARLRNLEERLRRIETEHAQQGTRQRQLLSYSQTLLAEKTIEGLLPRIVDSARELTGARIGIAGYGYRDGTFLAAAASSAEDAPPFPDGEIFGVERSGVYLDLVVQATTRRLNDEELRAGPIWRELGEGRTALRGLLVARLAGPDGQANGLIVVSDKEEGGEFTADDEEILEQVAAIASLALQHTGARQEAARHERELDAVLDAIADGVVVFDRSGTPVRASKAAVAVAGFDPVHVDRDVAGRLTVRHPDGRALGMEEMTLARARDGEPISVQPLVIENADGKETSVVASGAPLLDGDEVLGAVLVWHDVTERRHAEEALRESERQQRELARSLEAERSRLATILESLPVGVWVSDHNGQLIEKNLEADRIWAGDAPLLENVNEYTRYPARDAVSGKLLEPEDYPMARVLATGQPTGPVEVEIRRFDGTDGTVLVSAVPVKDAHGQLTGAVGINVDITARKRGEEERERLLEENRRQRQVLEEWIAAAPIGIAVLRGPEHRFELVNPYYRTTPGVPDVSLVGKRFTDVFPTVAGRRSLGVLDEVYRSGQPVHLRHYPGTPGSSTADTYWDADIHPLHDPRGATDGVFLLIRDVTEEVRARQRVEELAARDQAVLNSMSDGLVIFDLDGNLLEMNPAALRMHGFESVEEARRDVREFGPQFDLYHVDGRPIAVDDWPVPRVARGETYTAFETRVHNVRTGEIGVWSYNGAPVRDRDGNVILGVVTIRDVTAQKEIKAELGRQVGFLNQLIAVAPVGIAVVSGPDHRYELVNPAYHTIPGVPDVPMVGHTIAEVFPEVVAQGALAMVEEVYRTHETVGVNEYRASVGPGREDTYWNVYHVPLAGPEGEVERVLILAQEVTYQVRARAQIEQAMAELAEERARLNAIVHNAPAGITLVDAEARIVFTNPVADQIYARPVPHGQAYERHAALHLCYPDGTPYDPRDLPMIRSALDGETWQDVEMLIVWPDGQRRDLLVNTAPIHNADGQVLGAVGVFQDVTERKETRDALRRARDELEERVVERTRALVERTIELQRAEETLRRQNDDLLAMQRRLDQERQRYRELFDFAPDGYLLTDKIGFIQEANRAGVELLGAAESSLPGQSLSHFVDPADRPAFAAYLSELGLAQSASPARWEMRIQRVEQAPIYAAAAATPSYSVTGEVEGVRWLLRDVTHEKQMQAALVQAEKLAMAGRLASALAHEINNPLSAAMGSVELVREALEDAQDPTQLLDTMYRSLARASRIVSQLRDAHRRHGPEEKKAADLNDVVEGVLLLLGKTATSAAVEISWERVDDLPFLPLMVDGMQQVFLNLVLNAIEAMEGGGHLDVRIRHTQRPGLIGVEFSNDGPAIAPEIQARLFEPFETTKKEGTGLGLFISQNIVQQHGGTIEVETAEGNGATFTVWLPV